MARTAPVPNIPAIPGMCPGIVVAGGGGGSGGGSGKGAGGGGGGTGAGGEGGAEDTSGDGRAADAAESCGPGGGSQTCPQHNSSASRGDPVDVASGTVFTRPSCDLVVYGPLQLVFTRRYRSALFKQDVGLGRGWTHSLAWRVEPRRRDVWVHAGNGERVTFPTLQVGEQAIGKYGWLLRRESWGYALDANDDMWRIFSDEGRDGIFRLSAVDDRCKRRIQLDYDERGYLQQAVAPGQRTVRFDTDGHGRVTAVKLMSLRGTAIVAARYEYDAAGDLVVVSDGDGHTSRFAYENHLLVRHVDAAGVTIHYRYDQQRRCIETWAGTADDPCLSPRAPKVLADGRTRAKGVFHCLFLYGDDGYREVTDSVHTQRMFANDQGTIDKAVSGGSVVTREFDDSGFVRAVQDPLGGVVRFNRDQRGRIVDQVDPLNRKQTFTRDAGGRIIEHIDALGTKATVDRDARGNVTRYIDRLGNLYSFTYRADGALETATSPLGRSHYSYDVYGNLTQLQQPDGSCWQFDYDDFGRTRSVTDPLGSVERYEYSVRGDLSSFTDPLGATHRYEYDGVRKLVALSYPDGAQARIERSGFHWPLRVRKPDGSTFERRYDREGRIAEVHNAKGEVHQFVTDPEGFLIEERTFDGRTLRYDYDEGRRMVRYEPSPGQYVDMSYDAAGNLTEVVYLDDTTHTFEYDERGHCIAARTGRVDVTFVRNAFGQIEREEVTADGQTAWVSLEYDASGGRRRRHTSLGHEQQFERDMLGNPTTIRLDGKREIGVDYDAVGRVERRRLPSGGAVEYDSDRVGRLKRQRVLGPRNAEPTASAPQWVGAVPPNVTAERAFSYSQRGDLVGIWDTAMGSRELDYDAIGQLVGVKQDGQQPQQLSYDATGNLHRQRQARSYGSGNVLEAVGTTRCVWDDLGRLVERREGDGEPWRFEYDGASMLSRVTTPQRSTVEMLYDAFGRRVVKRVSAQPDDTIISSRTRYVWDGEVLVHELCSRASRGHDPVVSERTYCINPNDQLVWAQADGSSGERRWAHLVNDPSGAPTRLLDDRAAVVGELDGDAFGERTATASSKVTTNLRFPGQYADTETGLHYNRFRYYHPQDGRYISADPIGLLGGLNLFRYVENIPTTFSDPTGLGGGAIGYVVMNDGTVIPRSGRMAESGMPRTPHTDSVRDALPRRSDVPAGERPAYPPGVCVEAHLMSEMEREGYTPEDIAPGGLVVMNGRHPHAIKAPCPYCERMLADMGVQPSQIRTS